MLGKSAADQPAGIALGDDRSRMHDSHGNGTLEIAAGPFQLDDQRRSRRKSMPEQQADAADGNVQDFARPSRIFEGAALAGHLAAAGVAHPGPTLDGWRLHDGILPTGQRLVHATSRLFRLTNYRSD